MSPKYEAPGAPEHVQAFLNECYEAGEAAGSWVIDGNTPEDSVRSILAGIEDGDPMVLDSLPSPLWNGEWADERTYDDLATAAGLSEDEANDYYGEAMIAFSTGVEDEVTRSARAVL